MITQSEQMLNKCTCWNIVALFFSFSPSPPRHPFPFWIGKHPRLVSLITKTLQPSRLYISFYKREIIKLENVLDRRKTFLEVTMKILYYWIKEDCPFGVALSLKRVAFNVDDASNN